MDISNKTLAMFLVAAIVASIAGTMISLDKLGGIGYGPTGFAPHDYTGNVTINITKELSITISSDTLINFGDCAPISGQTTFVRSDQATIGDTGTACTNFVADDEFVVLNDGNVDANVTVNTTAVGTAVGGSFLPDANNDESYLSYQITDDDTGCTAGNRPAGWHNFTSTGTAFRACDNLTYSTAQKDFNFDIGIGMPADTTPGTGVQNVSIIFWGQYA